MKIRILLAALLTLAFLGTASAQVGLAYAHVSLTIRYGGGHEPTYEVDASLYPSLERDVACRYTCPTGMATPFGYWYDGSTFDYRPELHTEEIDHIKQWEALGPAVLIAYLATAGEAFEPYHARSFVPAANGYSRD